QGPTEALVAVGERLVPTGRLVAPAVVPGDQLLAHLDHGQLQAAGTPLLARDALALLEHAAAETTTLAARAHGEHAEVRGPAPLRWSSQLAARDDPATLLGEQHGAVVPVEHLAQHRGVDALALEQVGLGGPPLPAGIAAVGRLDEVDDDGHVVVG